MAPKRSAVVVEVDGHELELSNLDKVLYPSGFTKGEVIDYYARIAPTMLAHLGDRAITLKRYPNGVDGKFFYEKNCPKAKPEWMQTAPIQSEDGYIESRREILEHLVVHTSYHRGFVAQMMYDAGVRPPTTDLTVYLRDAHK